MSLWPFFASGWLFSEMLSPEPIRRREPRRWATTLPPPLKAVDEDLQPRKSKRRTRRQKGKNHGS